MAPDRAFSSLPPSHTHRASDIHWGRFDPDRLPTSSETLAGAVKLATTAGAVTGTDTTTAVTPAGLAAAIYTPGAAGTGVAYSAGWGDYGGAYTVATWYRDKDGWIRLSGLLKRTGSTITSAGTGTIFTLPVGARPAGTETFIMNSGTPVFCQIQANGTAQVAAPNTWTSGAGYMYLGGCQFRAA